MKKINDLISSPSEVRLLFLLESPYKDELIHNHPLAGNSGKAVTKYIYENSDNIIPHRFRDIPLGCILKNSDLPILGIMNTSVWPLDKKCYPCNSRSIKSIAELDFIRKYPKPKSRKDVYNKRTERFLFYGFYQRLRVILAVNSQVKIVPCGELAEKFLSGANLPNEHVLSKVPHPSFKQLVWKHL